MLEKMSELPVVVQSDSGVAGYNKLAAIFFLNTLVPWIQIFTNREYLEADCPTCILELLIFLATFWIPSLIFWGIPLLSMGLYALIGRNIGLEGSLLKFMILYTARFGGLLWHIVSQAIGASLV